MMSIEEEFEKLKSTILHLKDRQDILDCIQRESRVRDRQDLEMIARCGGKMELTSTAPS